MAPKVRVSRGKRRRSTRVRTESERRLKWKYSKCADFARLPNDNTVSATSECIDLDSTTFQVNDWKGYFPSLK